MGTTIQKLPEINPEEYIKERLISQKEWFSRKSGENKAKYRLFKRLEIILAASIPVMVTIGSMGVCEDTIIWSKLIKVTSDAGETVTISQNLLTGTTLLNIITAAAGVLLVIFSKFVELDEYYKNWKTYRVTAEELEQERFLFLTRTTPYDDQETSFKELVGNVEAILNKENQSWRNRTKVKTTELLEKAQNAIDKQNKINDDKKNEYPDV